MAAANSNAVAMIERQRQSEYMSKAAAAERLGLSVRRVLELSLSGAIRRRQVTDPVTKRRQTVFLAADLERLIEDKRQRAAALAPNPDAPRPADCMSRSEAAERLGLSVRRVLELSARGLFARQLILDPVTKRRQSAFRAADVERFIERRKGIVPPAPDPPWLTIEEAAVYSGLPVHYLERQIRDGRLGAIDVGIGPGVCYCVARHDLDAISATRQAEPGIESYRPSGGTEAQARSIGDPRSGKEIRLASSRPHR